VKRARRGWTTRDGERDSDGDESAALHLAERRLVGELLALEEEALLVDGRRVLLVLEPLLEVADRLAKATRGVAYRCAAARARRLTLCDTPGRGASDATLRRFETRRK